MAGANGGNGLATAVEMLGGFAGLGLDGGEQPELFADADDAPMPMPEAPRTGRAGRPKGAKNRSTEQWRDYILARYRSPLVALAEMWSRTPAQLAADLGLYKFHEGKMVVAPVLDANGVWLEDGDGKPRWQPVLATGDAAAMQQAAMIAALPYLHQKQPLAIQGLGGERGLLVLGDLNVAVQQQSDGLAPPFAPPEQNQQVIDVTPAKSDDAQSDELANALSYKDDLNDDQ